MSETRVPLHVRLIGEVVPIAYCRHAQVRILLREGQAAWYDGQLVLTGATPRPKDGHPLLAPCYEDLDRHAFLAVETLSNAELVVPILEAGLGVPLRVRRLRSTEVVISFRNFRNDEEDHLKPDCVQPNEVHGWFEISETICMYLNRHGDQEVIRITPERVARIGKAGTKPAKGDDERRRWREYTPASVLDALAFEMRAVAAVLADPKAPLLIDHPYPGE